MDKGSTVEAVNKLKRAATAKDEKIIELQRVIESERAVVRKAESDKMALEKKLKSLRVSLYTLNTGAGRAFLVSGRTSVFSENSHEL